MSKYITEQLQLTSKALEAVPLAGMEEFLTDKYYKTITTGTARKEIELYDMYYGEMWSYENTSALVIPVANQYIAVQSSNIVTGSCAGFTFTAGVNGAIASVADYAGTVAGTILITVTAGHNLVTGDYITIYNTTNYNGAYRITTVSPTTYYVTKAYVATNTGNYARGVRLVANTGSAGTYKITLSLTAVSASANRIIKFEVCQNATFPDKIAMSNAFASTDYTPMSSSGFMTIADGDHIWFQMRNETSGTNLTIRHSNFNLSRI